MDDLHKLSIVICYPFGRIEQFKRGLNSLYYQDDIPKNTELLIMNDGGDKELPKLLSRYRGKFLIRHFVHHKDKNKINHACKLRNFLIRKAGGDFLLITDPEIVHYSNTLSQVYAALSKEEKIWYCGPVYSNPSYVNKKGYLVNWYSDRVRKGESVLLGDSPTPNKKLDLSYYKNCGFFNKVNENEFKSLMWCTGLHKSDVLKVRGFNENLFFWGHDDLDLYDNLMNVGVKRLYDVNFICYHLPHKMSSNSDMRFSWDVYNANIRIFNKNSDDWGSLNGERIIEEVI